MLSYEVFTFVYIKGTGIGVVCFNKIHKGPSVKTPEVLRQRIPESYEHEKYENW